MPFVSHCFAYSFLFVAMTAFVLHADNTVQYKTRTYTPGKTASQKTFQEKPYSSSKAQTQRSYETEKSYTSDDHLLRQKSATDTPFESQKKAVESAPAEHTLYTPSEQKTTVSTMSANPAVVTDEKPFESQTGTLESKVYKPREKKPETNPLLRPKQGIKEQGDKQQ